MVQVPVIDLFAGPGGLAEGFSAFKDSTKSRAFKIALSIEKDSVAHRTLHLRALFRAFGNRVPDAYYDYVLGHITNEELLGHPQVRVAADQAVTEAVCAELGAVSDEKIDRLIRQALAGASEWILIGGPPCQAYSMVGRSRLQGADPAKYASDPRHLLYKEYLRVIARHRPSIFVMENVKGMLSSQYEGKPIFDHILRDLRAPSPDLAYEVRSFVVPRTGENVSPRDFVIRSEFFGLPQTRHRVILLGVRKDLSAYPHSGLKVQDSVSVRDVLAGLPRIRSCISREADSDQAWTTCIAETRRMLVGWKIPERDAVIARMEQAERQAFRIRSTGAQFISGEPKPPKRLEGWLCDSRLGGVLQHESRSHMRSDLHRYFFSACFADVLGASPRLEDLPERLQPNHANVSEDDVPFKDRFRVQVWRNPSSTVVSHIAKDGHYFIHPDAAQCRSLTVREAARLQTFPDNYFFEGNRTQQFVQVGNAVPPYLARQLAASVFHLLSLAGSRSDDIKGARSSR